MDINFSGDINTLFKELLKNQDLSQVFDNYDFNNYLNTALTDVHKDITRYIKSHRLDLYKNHYPYFFRPVVNHMLLLLERVNFYQFQPFEIRSNFQFDIINPKIAASMQSVSPFTYHPFKVDKIVSLSNELRIDINSAPILFNHDELLVWINPRISLDNFIKTKQLLKHCHKVEMVYQINEVEYKMELLPKQVILYDQPFLMQVMLHSVSPQMFGYQAFDIPKLELIENQTIKLEYISIQLNENSELPDKLNQLFMFNLMPVLSMLDDYAAPIILDGSHEYYPITASESTAYKTFYMVNELLLENKRILEYASSESEFLNYIIRYNAKQICDIKINSNLDKMLNKQLQIYGTWTQFLDINQYQNKSIKILDRDKMTYSSSVIFKNGYVNNTNEEKIDCFIELSNLINYNKFDKKAIQSIVEISSLNATAREYLNTLVSVEYQQNRKQLILSFQDGSQLEKLYIQQGVEQLGLVLDYLINDNIEIVVNFHKHYTN